MADAVDALVVAPVDRGGRRYAGDGGVDAFGRAVEGVVGVSVFDAPGIGAGFKVTGGIVGVVGRAPVR